MTTTHANLKRTLRRFTHPPAPGPFERKRLQSSSAAALLHIPTADGTGQACHPSVAYVRDAIGGFRFWMANTPYAGNLHKIKNPELFASHDGVFWQVPQGLQNPLVQPPKGDHRHYHSDPCLLSHEQRLWLYFRTSDEEASPRRDWLSLMVSDDGRNWTRPRKIVEESGSFLLSPSVRFVDGEFRMWTVELEPGSSRFALVQRTSPDGEAWSSPQQAELSWPGTPLEPWHIEVVRTGEELAMMFSARQSRTAGTQGWQFATGDGLHWQVHRRPTAEPCLFEAGKQCKPSLLLPTEGWPNGWLYTSSEGSDGTWYTALRPGPFNDE